MSEPDPAYRQKRRWRSSQPGSANSPSPVPPAFAARPADGGPLRGLAISSGCPYTVAMMRTATRETEEARDEERRHGPDA
jgi:hypothetical protein